MALSPDQIDLFQKTGFVTASKALSETEIADLCAEWQRLWEAIDTTLDHQFVHWRETSNGKRVADRLDPVSQHSEIFKSAANSPALRGLAESLLGGRAFVLKDKLISKLPQTNGYGLHQDWPYWANSGIQPDDVLSIAVALDPATKANGATAFYRGQHVGKLPTDEAGLDVDPKALGGLEPEIIAMAPGDAVCFHSLTPHQSQPNQTKSSRRAWFITYAKCSEDNERSLARYNAALDRVHKAHRRDALA